MDQLNNDTHFMVIMPVNVCWPVSPVKNWKVILERSFTVCMLSLTVSRAFRLGEDPRVLLGSVTLHLHTICNHTIM